MHIAAMSHSSPELMKFKDIWVLQDAQYQLGLFIDRSWWSESLPSQSKLMYTSYGLAELSSLSDSQPTFSTICSGRFIFLITAGYMPTLSDYYFRIFGSSTIKVILRLPRTQVCFRKTLNGRTGRHSLWTKLWLHTDPVRISVHRARRFASLFRYRGRHFKGLPTGPRYWRWEWQLVWLLHWPFCLWSSFLLTLWSLWYSAGSKPRREPQR